MVRKNTTPRSESITETVAGLEVEFQRALRQKEAERKQAELVALFPDAELVDAPVVLGPVSSCFVFMGLGVGVAIPAYMIATR